MEPGMCVGRGLHSLRQRLAGLTALPVLLVGGGSCTPHPLRAGIERAPRGA